MVDGKEGCEDVGRERSIHMLCDCQLTDTFLNKELTHEAVMTWTVEVHITSCAGPTIRTS